MSLTIFNVGRLPRFRVLGERLCFLIVMSAVYRLYIPMYMYDLEVYPAENIWRGCRGRLNFAVKRGMNSGQFSAIDGHFRKIHDRGELFELSPSYMFAAAFLQPERSDYHALP